MDPNIPPPPDPNRGSRRIELGPSHTVSELRIDAGRLWAGGVATALVAALVAIVGVLVCSVALDTKPIAPSWLLGNSENATISTRFAITAAVAALRRDRTAAPAAAVDAEADRLLRLDRRAGHDRRSRLPVHDRQRHRTSGRLRGHHRVHRTGHRYVARPRWPDVRPATRSPSTMETKTTNVVTRGRPDAVRRVRRRPGRPRLSLSTADPRARDWSPDGLCSRRRRARDPPDQL